MLTYANVWHLLHVGEAFEVNPRGVFVRKLLLHQLLCPRPKPAYVSIRQHTSAYGVVQCVSKEHECKMALLLALLQALLRASLLASLPASLLRNKTALTTSFTTSFTTSCSSSFTAKPGGKALYY
jgi:hypothetical protein